MRSAEIPYLPSLTIENGQAGPGGCRLGVPPPPAAGTISNESAWFQRETGGGEGMDPGGAFGEVSVPAGAPGKLFPRE